MLRKDCAQKGPVLAHVNLLFSRHTLHHLEAKICDIPYYIAA